MESNKKTLLVVIILAALVLIVVLAFSFGKKSGQELENNLSKSNTGLSSSVDNMVTQSPVNPALSKILEESRVEAPGANPITVDNKVITVTGQQTKTSVAQNDALAPTQTGALDKAKLDSSVVQINISLGSFSPNEFRVKAGAPVTLSLTSNDIVHSLVFDNPVLQAVAVAVAGGETRAITFQAPTKGSYSFKCNVGGDTVGHVTRGEAGTMIVE